MVVHADNMVNRNSWILTVNLIFNESSVHNLSLIYIQNIDLVHILPSRND